MAINLGQTKQQHMEYKGGKDSVLGTDVPAPPEEEAGGQYGWFSILDNTHWKPEMDEYGWNYWFGDKWVDDGTHGTMIALEAINDWTKNFYPEKISFNTSYPTIPVYFHLMDEDWTTLVFIEPAIVNKETRINWPMEKKPVKYLFMEHSGTYDPVPYDLTELEFFIPKP